MKSTVSGSSVTCICETGPSTDATITATDPQMETFTMITEGSGAELETTTITDGSGAETDPTEVTGTGTPSLKATTECVCVNATTLSHKTTG